MRKGKGGLTLADACLEDASEQQAHVRKIVDEHMQWMMGWHRLAFFSVASPEQSVQAAKDLPTPKSFGAWFKGPAQRLSSEQRLIDRLAILHDQMHRFAKMTLVKAEGRPLLPLDYEMVMERYFEFMNEMRAFERVFSAATAGLDTLTGLRSRFSIGGDLAAEQKRTERTGHPFCVAIGDIDRFRTVNDLHGLETGDRALVQLADTISKTIRNYDDAYRLGGEEFLICLKGTTAEHAHKVIERLRQSIAAQPIRLFGGGSMNVTISFGIVEAKPNEDVHDLLDRAMACLQQAKDEGGNFAQLAG